MKTKIKSLLIMLGFTLLSMSKASAQAGCFSNTMGTPFRTEIQSLNSILDFTTEPSINPCNTSAGGNLTGVGINQSNPQYILDIVGNYVGDGVNVSSGSNQVGYSIGGQMVLWTLGDPSSIYVGVGAGSPISVISGENNIYVS